MQKNVIQGKRENGSAHTEYLGRDERRDSSVLMEGRVFAGCLTLKTSGAGQLCG